MQKSIFPHSKRSENVWWGNPLNKQLSSDHSANHMLHSGSRHEKKVSKKKLFPSMHAPSHMAREDPLADRNLSDLQQEHRMGTSIMALCYDGGVIMGADTRTSTGSYVANRVSGKLNPISANIYVARCGSAADSQAIIDIVKYNIGIHHIELNTLPLVSTAANVFKYFLYNNKGHLSTGIICAGYDSHNGGSVYSIAGGGTLLKVPIMFMGSGSTYIYALVDAEYRADMSKEEAKQLVQKALSHCIARDGSSGGCIRMVTIDKDGVETSFIPGNKVPDHNF